MTETSYKLTIEGPGISIVRDVDESILPRLMLLLVQPGRLETAHPGLPEASASSERPPATSIAEFLAGLNVKTNPDRIAGIALFVRERLGQSTVNKDDLPSWFQKAGQGAPKNLHRDLKVAVAQRLVAEDHALAGEYLVTDTGVRELRAGNGSDEGSLSTRKPSRVRRSSSNGSSGARKASPNGQGPMAKVQELADEGWFGSPRTVAQLVEELATRGVNYKAPDLTYQMQQLVQTKKLRRKKETPPGGKRPVWHYSNW